MNRVVTESYKTLFTIGGRVTTAVDNHCPVLSLCSKFMPRKSQFRKPASFIRLLVADFAQSKVNPLALFIDKLATRKIKHGRVNRARNVTADDKRLYVDKTMVKDCNGVPLLTVMMKEWEVCVRLRVFDNLKPCKTNVDEVQQWLQEWKSRENLDDIKQWNRRIVEHFTSKKPKKLQLTYNDVESWIQSALIHAVATNWCLRQWIVKVSSNGWVRFEQCVSRYVADPGELEWCGKEQTDVVRYIEQPLRFWHWLAHSAYDDLRHGRVKLDREEFDTISQEVTIYIATYRDAIRRYCSKEAIAGLHVKVGEVGEMYRPIAAILHVFFVNVMRLVGCEKGDRRIVKDIIRTYYTEHRRNRLQVF